MHQYVIMFSNVMIWRQLLEVWGCPVFFLYVPLNTVAGPLRTCEPHPLRLLSALSTWEMHPFQERRSERRHGFDSHHCMQCDSGQVAEAL